jgi:hypothetical protein
VKEILVPLPDMGKEDLIQLVLASVAENERLLRACHAQRDRARRAEARARRAEDAFKCAWKLMGMGRSDAV